MPLTLIAFRALHFWAVAVLFGGGGFLRLLGLARLPFGLYALRASAVIAAVTGTGWFVLTFVNVTGGADGLGDQQALANFLASPFGPPWAIQLGLGVLALALCAACRPILFIGLGAAFAIDQAWLGHAAAGTGALGITMIITYAAHVLAGFGWVGALSMLCLTLQVPEALRDALTLFSTLGLFGVAAILASGCLNAAFHMNRLSELTTTTYGHLVLVKLAIFVAMLGLAAWNRREGRLDRIDTRRVALGVGVETVLGLAVLCAAAALGITDPSA